MHDAHRYGGCLLLISAAPQARPCAQRTSLDYLIVNHMEPDHGGSIGLLRKRYPQMQIVGNRPSICFGASTGSRRDSTVKVEIPCVSDGTSSPSSWLLWCTEPSDVHLRADESYALYSRCLRRLWRTGWDLFDSQLADRSFILQRDASLLRRGDREVWGLRTEGLPLTCSARELDVDFVCPTHGVVWTKEGFGEALALYERLPSLVSQVLSSSTDRCMAIPSSW